MASEKGCHSAGVKTTIYSLSLAYWNTDLCCREPEALPFCALAYALIGIMSTLLIAVPGSVDLFMTLAGHA